MPVYELTSNVTFMIEAADEEDAIYEIEFSLSEVASDWTPLVVK